MDIDMDDTLPADDGGEENAMVPIPAFDVDHVIDMDALAAADGSDDEIPVGNTVGTEDRINAL